MIRLRGHMICQTMEESAAVHWHMADHIALSRAEPGCVSFDITATDDPLSFEVIESLRTREDFDAHQARTRIGPWFEATRQILRDFRVEELRD
jgi:quinol monooxygenase YgiN